MLFRGLRLRFLGVERLRELDLERHSVDFDPVDERVEIILDKALEPRAAFAHLLGRLDRLGELLDFLELLFRELDFLLRSHDLFPFVY